MTNGATSTCEPLMPAFSEGQPILLAPCWHCDAAVGKPCVKTTDGTAARQPHKARWGSYALARRGRQMWFLLRKDDPVFGLSAGDLLRCVAYPYHAKVTVLLREDNGFEPECNQYLHDVAFLGFVPTDMEVR